MSDPAQPGSGDGSSGGLTHVDDDGRARMVDVSGKPVTVRSATATGRLVTTPDVVALVRSDGMPKADVLPTARIAGIAGAKRTSELIPLCHPIPLTSLEVLFGFTDDAILIEAVARTTGVTGVEMEALTAVAIAGLTLHDMVKAVDPRATLTEVQLTAKSGGKRGDWTRDAAAGTGAPAGSSTDAATAPSAPAARPAVRPGTAAVVVASTGAAAGTREDTTGPVIRTWLEEHGYAVDAVTIVADADIASALRAAVATAPAVLLTTGGTGLSPTDRTPEATRPLLDAQLPGIEEAIRARGLATVPTAALSRGLAGVAGGTVVVNLPGSRGGVADGLAVLDPLIAHLVAQIAGAGAHD